MERVAKGDMIRETSLKLGPLSFLVLSPSVSLNFLTLLVSGLHTLTNLSLTFVCYTLIRLHCKKPFVLYLAEHLLSIIITLLAQSGVSTCHTCMSVTNTYLKSNLI